MSGLAPQSSLLVAPPGSVTPALTLTDVISGLSWSRGQHGPASLSAMVPGEKFRALPAELKRNARLWLMVNGVCRWSGYLLPPATGKAAGGLMPLSGAGSYAIGMCDESFCKTWSVSDVALWEMRKGSSSRLGFENSGTLRLTAEGGYSTGTVPYKSGTKIEALFILDGGLGSDDADTIGRLDFTWNLDLSADWRAYIDCLTDGYDGVKLDGGTTNHHLWERTNFTGRGEAVALTPPAGTRALVFGLAAIANNVLADPSFAELADVSLSVWDDYPTVGFVMAVIANQEMGANVVHSDVFGVGAKERRDLIWPFGSGSRSYCMEQFAALVTEKTDWRYVPTAAGQADDFIVQPMPTTPTDRSRHYVVRSSDPGVTCDLEHDLEEGTDIVCVAYKAGPNLITAPTPRSTEWPADWELAWEPYPVVAESYLGYAFPRSFLMVCSAGDTADMWSKAMNVVPGQEYTVAATFERVSTVFGTGAGISATVWWYDSDGSLFDSDGPPFVDHTLLGSQGAVARVSLAVTAPAGAATACVGIQFDSVPVGPAAIAVRNVHLDRVNMADRIAEVFYPAAPAALSDRVHTFDFSEQKMNLSEALDIAEGAYEWYGCAPAERDRAAIGPIEITAPVQTIDGLTAYPWEMADGDFITVLDDDQHAWPQRVMATDHGDDGRSAALTLGGDGGDYNYIGRAESPVLQKRARAGGRHKHNSWAKYNAQEKAREKAQARRDKAAEKSAKRQRPKYAPG